MNKIENAGRYAEIKKKLCGYAEKDENIRAVVAIGSSVRENVPADEYSDLDLIIVTSDPGKWYSGEYPELLGRVDISFIEPTLGGGKERRAIYDGENDVDMMIFTPEQFEKALEDGQAGWVMNRGYRFLYDEGRFTNLARRYVKLGAARPEMSEEEYINIVNDFYFHNIWACKKLLRGELWSAKLCVDSYLKTRFLKIAEQYQILVSDTDVWHDGRFFDKWADKSVLGELENCFSRYDIRECTKALKATHSLFARLSEFVAEKKSWHYPEEAEKCAARYLDKHYPAD